jgi:hypothetical protein
VNQFASHSNEIKYMGVDAEILITTDKKFTKKEVRHLAYELSSAFGRDPFWIDRADDRHALNICNEDYMLLTIPEEERSKQVLQVSTLMRYYGEGYERGPAAKLLMVMLWLKNRIPKCKVFYGGDTGAELEEVTDEYWNNLFNYWCQNRTEHYKRSFTNLGGKTNPIEHCNFCDVEMVQCGWGNEYSGYRCLGCGLEVEINKGVRTEKIED